MDTRAQRQSANEAVFRQVNERIASAESDDPTFEIICECSDVDCMEHIRITPAVYERARSEPTRFLVKPGHTNPQLETIVERHPEFLIVRKIGDAAAVAEELDPRV